jgi:soluble lytic murein transglycosylase-like protein
MHSDPDSFHPVSPKLLAVAGVFLGGLFALALWQGMGQVRHRASLEPPPTIWTRGDSAVAAIIRIECGRYGIPEQFALCVADQESRFDPRAVGDRGDAIGLYQFHLGTWRRFRNEMGLGPEDLRADARAAARTACWAFANGYARRWTVVRLGLCQVE